jgi:hypothetical protein
MTATNGVLAIDNFTGVTAGSVTPSKAVLVDASSDISGFGIVAANTFSGTLSGQVSTATQSSITSIPSLGTVGALNSGSITSGFGSIHVGTNSINAGTITASKKFVGDVAGNVAGTLTGQVGTAVQNTITSIPNLGTVGALNSGSIMSDFGSIDVGTSAISGGTITGTHITDGTASIQGGTVTANQVVVDSLTVDDGSLVQSSGTLSISSSSGTVAVDGVTFNAGAVTGVTTLAASGQITADTFSGDLSGATATLTGLATVGSLTDGVATLASGTISGLTKAVVDSLTLNDYTLSSSTIMQISAGTAKAVLVEEVSINDGAVTGISTLTTTGDVTLGGDIAVNGGDITSTAITFSISSSTGTVNVESVNFNGGAVTGITSLEAANTVTANTFIGAFSGEVSSDVLTASTLSVTSRFTLDADTEFYIGADEVTATATEINRLASIDTSNDTVGKLAVVNSDGYIHGSFKSLSSQGGTGVLLQNVLFDVRDVNGDTVFKIDPVSSDETIVKTARLAVDDSLLQVNANTSASVADNQHDIGIFGNLGAGKAAAVVYDRSDAAWKLVDDVNVPENAINTIAPTDAQLADLEVKGIRTAAGVQRAVATADTDGSTLSASNHIWFQDGDSHATLNLPTASGNIGREFIVRNTGSSTAITVSVQSGEDLNGTTDDTINISAGASARFIAEDGNSWWTI